MNVRELCLNSLNSVRNNFNDAANILSKKESNVSFVFSWYQIKRKQVNQIFELILEQLWR